MGWTESAVQHKVKQWLESNGYTVLARDSPKSTLNKPKAKIHLDKPRYVDIVAEKSDSIYLVEVKHQPNKSEIEEDILKLDKILNNRKALSELFKGDNISLNQEFDYYDIIPVIATDSEIPIVKSQNYIIIEDSGVVSNL